MSSLELASETPLHSILRMMQSTASSLKQIDWTKQDPLVEAGKIKVDSYKFIHDQLSAQLLYFDQLVAQYTAAKKSAKSQLEGFESHVRWVMESHQLEKVQGNDYVIQLTKSEFCDINAECLPRHRVIYGEWVKVKYEWSKTKITEALEGDDEELRAKALEIAKISQRTHPKFDIVKVERKKRGKNSNKSGNKSDEGPATAIPATPNLLPGPAGTGSDAGAIDLVGTDSILHAEPSTEHGHDALFDYEYAPEEPEAFDL